MSKRDSYGKYKRQANGTKNYEFYDFKRGRDRLIDFGRHRCVDGDDHGARIGALSSRQSAEV